MLADQGKVRWATGQHPRSRMVLIIFSKSVRWLGLPPGAARELAAALIHGADAMEEGRGGSKYAQR